MSKGTATFDPWVLNGVEEYSKLLEASGPLVSRWSPEMQAYLQDDLTELEAGKIRITVFGVQKAGKSTLCNALLRRRAATTGVPPMTNTVTEYEYRGALLVDTPGTQAREEETQRAIKAVSDANLLLVVVNWGVGKVSQQGLWDSLSEALDEAGHRKIPTVFILHDVDARLLNRNASVRASLAPVLQEVMGLAVSREVEFRILFCNAEEYLDNLLKGCDDVRFLEKTGIPRLERTLEHLLVTSGSVLRITKPLRRYVKAMRMVEHRIEKEMASLGKEEALFALKTEAVESIRTAAIQEVSRAAWGWGDSVIKSAFAVIEADGALEEGFTQGAADLWEETLRNLMGRISCRIDRIDKKWSSLDPGGAAAASCRTYRMELEVPQNVMQVVSLASAVEPISMAMEKLAVGLGNGILKKAVAWVVPGAGILAIIWSALEFLAMLFGGRDGREIAAERTQQKAQVRDHYEQAVREIVSTMYQDLDTLYAAEIDGLRAEGSSSKEQEALENDLVAARGFRSTAEAVLTKLVKDLAVDEDDGNPES